MTVGIIAIQGAFLEHAYILKKLGVKTRWVKEPADLKYIDRCIIPGGESTAISKQMCENGLMQALKTRIKEGMPTMGTCAGLVLMAKSVDKDPLITLGVMDIQVKRNAYGRQLGSFSTSASLPLISQNQVELIFIRAPYIQKVEPSVQIIHVHDSRIVAVLQNHMFAVAFHPELTEQTCFHEYFLTI
jgi:5'-phosphate synthase pdxT subunit